MKVRARVADLWRECDGGWTENASWARSVELEFPDGTTRTAIVRRIKSALGIVGMKVDSWCTSDFGPWRDGCIGAYADVID